MNSTTHANGTGTWAPDLSSDRRTAPDRRIEHAILSQESLARIVAETRGEDSYAGKALKQLEQRKAAAGVPATGDDEIIIFSLRGQWLVGTVRDIRRAMFDAAAAACRRRASSDREAALSAETKESMASQPFFHGRKTTSSHS
jgi:hypothetical protein